MYHGNTSSFKDLEDPCKYKIPYIFNIHGKYVNMVMDKVELE